MADIQTKLPVRSGIDDDTAFGVATEEVFPFAAFADETAPDSVDEGDIGCLRMTLTRLLKVKLIGDDGGSDVNIAVDSSGNLTVAAGAEYAEDSGHASGDVGNQVLAVRNDTGAVLAGTDLDYIPLTTNATGELRIAGSFSAGNEYAEDSPHTDGDTGGYVLSVREDTLAASTTADGDYQSLKTDGVGALWVNVANTSLTVDDGGGSLTVDGTVTADTNFDYAEDSPHTSADIGAFVLAVRNDAGTTLVDTDGDYAPLSLDAAGALRIAGSFSAGNEYAEDSVHTTGDTGGFVLSVREDTLAASTSATGDYQSFKTDGVGALWVNNQSVYAEDSIHATGDDGTFVLSVRNDTLAPLGGADGDYAPLQVNALGALYVSIANVADLDVVTNYEYAEDSVHTTADVGAFILTVRNDDQGSLADTDGDYAPLQVDSDGLLRVTIGATTDTANAIANYGTVASVASTSTGTISYDRTALTTTFLLKQVIATSSGAPCKVVITHTAGATTVAVGFYSTASPLINYTFAQPIPVASTATTAVSVAITNNAGPAQDVYATIIGEEV